MFCAMWVIICTHIPLLCTVASHTMRPAGLLTFTIMPCSSALMPTALIAAGSQLPSGPIWDPICVTTACAFFSRLSLT